jgi:ribosomal-protein-alanine N-acetyltransferase
MCRSTGTGEVPMIELRKAREDDVPALVALAKRSWRVAFADAPASFVAAREGRDFEGPWYARHWNAMTVAEETGVVVGLVQPELDEVNGLWVDPTAHRRGVGTLLLRAAEREIAAAGHGRAWLTCSGFNRQALGFYAARGYRETGSEPLARADGLVERLFTLERWIETDRGESM